MRIHVVHTNAEIRQLRIENAHRRPTRYQTKTTKWSAVFHNGDNTASTTRKKHPFMGRTLIKRPWAHVKRRFDMVTLHHTTFN